jgi:hypothetical protein
LAGSTYLLFYYYPALRYIPAIILYAGACTHIPATVPSPKVDPADPEDIPDGTYSPGAKPAYR